MEIDGFGLEKTSSYPSSLCCGQCRLAAGASCEAALPSPRYADWLPDLSRPGFVRPGVFWHLRPTFSVLDPKLVKFQFQCSTITKGFDPVAYFTKYPGRFIWMLYHPELRPRRQPPAGMLWLMC